VAGVSVPARVLVAGLPDALASFLARQLRGATVESAADAPGGHLVRVHHQQAAPAAARQRRRQQHGQERHRHAEQGEHPLAVDHQHDQQRRQEEDRLQLERQGQAEEHAGPPRPAP